MAVVRYIARTGINWRNDGQFGPVRKVGGKTPAEMRVEAGDEVPAAVVESEKGRWLLEQGLVMVEQVEEATIGDRIEPED